MSANIDERIVQMQFQNSQFESGVKESLKTLEKLKESLQLDKAAEGLRKLQDAGNSFSLGNISNNVDNLTERFSAFGTFAGRIIENLADTVYHKLGGALESVTIGQIGSGWQRYAEDTQAVQTIMFATDKSIEEVEAELERLTWFTDETSYNYADMVGNISKFTSAGVDLKDARVSMEGIATWAASAGQNAQTASRAMYNISQAMGMGSMKVADWKSIELANMATRDFKNNAIEAAKALGKLDSKGNLLVKTGKKAKQIQITSDNFRETLQYGWFDKDVMNKIFGEYGEFAEKVKDLQDEYYEQYNEHLDTSEAMEMLAGSCNLFSENAFKAAQEAKTFTEAIDALKDASTTKWMNIFKLIFGNYENAKVLWTKLANDLYEIFVDPLDDLVSVLREWHKVGEDGRSAWNDFMDGIYDIMDGLKGILVTVRDAFGDLIPDLTLEKLTSFSKAVKEFGASFKEMFGLPEEVSEEVKELGDTVSDTKDKIEGLIKGETETAFDETTDAIKEVEDEAANLEKALQRGARGEEIKAMQRKLVALGYDLPNFGVDGIWGPETDKAFREWQEAAGLAVDGVYDEAASQSLEEAFQLRHVGEEFKALSQDLKLGDRNDEVKELQERLIELGYDLDKYGADGIWGPETQRAYEQWQKENGMDPTGVYDQKAHEIMKTLLGYDMVVDAVGDVVKETEEAEEKTEKYGNRLDNIRSIFGGIAAIAGIASKVIAAIGKVIVHVWDLTEPLRDAFIAIGAAIGDSLIDFNKWLGESGTLDTWVESVKTALKPFGDFIQSVSDAILVFFELKKPVGETSEGFLTFSSVWQKVTEKVKNSVVFKSIASAITKVREAINKVRTPLKETGKTIKANFGNVFITILKLIGEALLLLLAPIGLIIGALGDFVAFVIEHIPSAIEWLTNLWNSLTYEGDESLGKAPGFLVKAKNFAKNVLGFLFGSVDENGETKQGIFSKLIALVTGDIATFKEGFSKDVQGVIDDVQATFQKIGAWITRVFTGQGGEELLGEQTIKNIDDFRNRVKGVFDKIYLLFTGNNREGSMLSPETVQSVLEFRTKVSDFFTSVGDTFKTVGATIRYLFTGIDKDGIVPEGAKEKIDAVREKITEIVESIKTSFKTFIPKMKLLFTGDTENTTLSNEDVEKVMGFRDGIINFWEKVKGAFEKVRAFLTRVFTGKGGEDILGAKTIKGIDDFRASITNFLNTLRDTFGGLWEELQGVFANGIDFESIKTAIAVVWNRLANLFKGIWESAKPVLKWGIVVFILYKLATLIGSITGGFDSIKKVILSYRKNAEPLSKKLIAFGASILMIGGAIGIIIGAMRLIGDMDDESYTRAMLTVGGIMAFLVAVTAIAAKFVNKESGKTINKIGQAILDFSLAIGILVAAIWALGTLVTNDVFKNGLVKIAILMGVLAGFMAVLAIINRFLGTPSADLKGKIWQLAVVIVAMGVVVKMLGGMKDEKAERGIKSLLWIMGSLGLLLAIVAKLGGNVKLRGLIGLSFAIATMAAIIVVLGFIKKERVIKGGIVVGGMMLLLDSLAFLFGKFGKQIKTSQMISMLIGVAAVIAVFGYVIDKIKDVDPKVMLGFSGSMAIALASFVGACMLAGKFGSGGSGKTGSMFKGALSIVGSLVIFAATALLFVGAAGFIDKWLSNNGYDGVFENGKNVLTAVGNALVAFGDSIGASIQTVADFLIASEIVGIINKYAESNTLLNGAFSIVTALALVIVAALVLVGAAGAIDQVMSNLGYEGIFETGKTVLTTVGTALTGFCESIGADIQTIADFLLASEIIGLINQYTGSNAMISGAWSIAAALSSVIAAALIIVGAAGFIDQWLGNNGYESVFETGKEVLQSTAEAISGFMSTLNISMTDLKLALVVGAIIGNAGLSGGTIVGAAAIGIAIDALIATLELFVGVNGWINKITDGKWTEYITEGGKVLQAFGEALAGFISGFTSVFITQINDFGTAIANVREAINGLSTDESEGTLDSDMETALGMAKKIHDFFSDLEPYTTITFDAGGGITYENNANTLSTDIEAFGRGMATLWNGISGISTDNTFEGDLTYSEQVATDLQSFFAGIADKMPSGQGLKDYNKAIDAIMGDVATFGTTMNSFRTNIEGFGAPMMEYDVETAVTAATAVADFCEKVGGMDIETKAKGIAGWFSKETSQETVIDTIGELANSIAKNGSKFRGLSSGTLAEDVKAAMKPMYQIASFLDFLSDDNMNTTDAIDINGNMSKLNGVLSGVGNIAHSIKGFSDYVGDIDLSSIASVIQAVTNFIGLLISDTNISPNDIFSQLDVETISARFSEIITAVNTSVNSSTNIETLKNVGQSISDNVISGLSKADTSGASSYVTSMTKNLWSFSYYRDFFTIGQHFANGLSSGVYANARYGIEAAAYIAKRMVNEIKTIFATASPSKVTKKIGEYFSEGLALGVDHKSDTAIRSTEEVAESMLNTAQGTLTNLSDLLADDIDTTPTISPVVDLTNARNAAASISDLFGGNQQSSVTMTRTLADKTELDADGAQIKNARVVDTESALSLRDGIEAIKQGLSDMGSGDVVNEIQSLSDKFGSLAEAVSNMKLVLDTGALVGGTYAAYDRQFGKSSAMADRGN